MKIATKIEIGIIAFVSIAAIFFQYDLNSRMSITPDEFDKEELSNIIQTKDYNISNYDTLVYNIETHSNDSRIKVSYSFGAPKVKITSDKKILEKIDVKVESGILYLESLGDKLFLGDDFEKYKVEIEIFGPNSINKIKVKEPCIFKVRDTLRNDHLNLVFNGPSQSQLNIISDSLTVYSAHHADISLYGRANHISVEGKNNSNVNGRTMFTKSLDLKVKNHLEAEFTVINHVSGSIYNDARVVIHGDPRRVIIREGRNGKIVLKD